MKRLIVLFFLTLPIYLGAQVTFKGSAARAVVVNEQFRVNYTLTSDSERGNLPRLPEVSGLQILFGPTLSQRGSSTNIVNGNVSTSITEVYTFVLVAEKEGEYTLPPATIKVGNSEYKSNELTIKVLPQDQATQAANTNAQAAQQQAARENTASVSNDDVFIRMHVSKSSVYENEGFLVTFKVYSAIDFSGFESMKFPEFEGFVAQEIDLPQDRQWSLENYQGRNYRTVILKQSILYPQRTGKIPIGPGKFEVVVRQRVESQRRSIFDMFDSYTNVKKTLTSSGAAIDVKALPSGKPASFSGAVGEYKLSSTISSTQVKAGEPVTIKVNLSGSGNIKLLNPPAIVFPNDFELFDPKTDISTKVNASGVSGTKTVEYYAVPNYAGDFTIPKAEFSYFDLKTGTYKTLATNEYKLRVAPGEGGGGKHPTIVSGVNKEDIRMLGEDIRYIKTNGFHFHPNGFFFGTLAYWLCYLIPLIIFVVLFIIYRKQVAENANVALMRTKKANKVASKRLKTAALHLKANERESFYDETLKAVWGYLSDKLTIPTANLTKDNVETELQRYGVSEQLIREFMDILNTAEFARFAPNQGAGAMDELYQQTVNAINSMEKI